jgi:hypothetical protein
MTKEEDVDSEWREEPLLSGCDVVEKRGILKKEPGRRASSNQGLLVLTKNDSITPAPSA